MPVDGWLMFDPPGFADRVFLVANDDAFDLAPSEQTLDEALAAARNLRAWDAAGRGDAVNRSSHKSSRALLPARTASRIARMRSTTA
jgi:hypothetical protein